MHSSIFFPLCPISFALPPLLHPSPSTSSSLFIVKPSYNKLLWWEDGTERERNGDSISARRWRQWWYEVIAGKKGWKFWNVEWNFLMKLPDEMIKYWVSLMRKPPASPSLSLASAGLFCPQSHQLWVTDPPQTYSKRANFPKPASLPLKKK